MHVGFDMDRDVLGDRLGCCNSRDTPRDGER
jgi:hypothetical protein